MTSRVLHLFVIPVLLVLLTSGSWGDAAAPEMLHNVVGKTLAVQCQYPPEQGPYKPKSWCRQISSNRCTRVVTTGQPRVAADDSRTMIWDAPDAGIFVVLLINLKVEDSGSYWCGSYNSTRNVIDILRNITLLVSPATTASPVQTAPTFPCTAIPSSPVQTSPVFPSSTALALSSEGTSEPLSSYSFKHRSQTQAHSGGLAAPKPLMVILYGLIVTMILGFLVPAVPLGYRDQWSEDVLTLLISTSPLLSQ